MSRLLTGLSCVLRKSTPKPSGGLLTLSSSLGWDGTENSAASAMRLSAVSACIEIVSNSIAMLPTFVMDEQSKRHVDDHYLADVLYRRPNEVMTPFALRQATEAHVMAYGNAYVFIYRDRAGRAVELLPIPEGWCYMLFDRAVGRWVYVATEPRSGNVYRLDPADILHYKAFTLDGIHGVSVLSRARRSVETAEMMEKHQNSIYRNGGRPSGILTVETDLGGVVDVVMPDGTVAKKSRKDVIREEWESRYASPDKAFRTAILDNGLKYQTVSVSNADAQFVENRAVSTEDICRFFCVPPYKLGIGKQSYASNEQNNIEFVATTLQPRITAREQEETWKLLTYSEQVKRHLRIRTNMTAVLRGDAKTRAEVQNIYRQNGTYSVNDIREQEDLPSVPGGDTRIARLDGIPLEHFGELATARYLAGNTKTAGEGGISP